MGLPCRRKRSPPRCSYPQWTMVCWSFSGTSTAQCPPGLSLLSRLNTPPSSSLRRNLSHRSAARSTGRRGHDSCHHSPAEGQRPSSPGHGHEQAAPAPHSGKIQHIRTKATEMLLLESILNSPGHSVVVAMGWVPQDQEGPCCAPCAASSLRAGRMGWGRAVMPTGLSQR